MTPIGLELWTRKPVKRFKWGLTDRNVKTVLLRAMWVMEAQLKRFQRGTVLANWARDPFCDFFFQRMRLLSALVLRICLELN